MNNVNHLDFCQPKGLLSSEVVEEPDKVIDMFLMALDIEEEEAWINEMKTSDRGGLRVCGSCQGLGCQVRFQISHSLTFTLISFSQTAPSIAL